MQIYHPPSFPTIDCNLQVIIIIINNHSYESQIFRKENQITLRISKINLTRKEKGICVTLKAWRALHPMSCRVLCKTGRVYLKESFPFPFPFPLSLFSSSSTTTMYSTFPTSIVVMSPPPLSSLQPTKNTEKLWATQLKPSFPSFFLQKKSKKREKRKWKGQCRFSDL